MVISLAITLSLGTASIFTVLVTYAEIAVVGCIVERYPYANVVCCAIEIVLAAIATGLNNTTSDRDIR